jgi:hypothetical protein
VKEKGAKKKTERQETEKKQKTILLKIELWVWPIVRMSKQNAPVGTGCAAQPELAAQGGV